MIYFIGGASRTGKSALAQKVANEKNISWSSLDSERDKLTGKPDDTEEIPVWFYPKLEELVKERSDSGIDHIFEGDCFYPEQITMLAKQFSVRVCFLGSSTIDANFLSSIDGWHLGNGIDLNVVATKVKERSEIFRRKSLENNFQYIDVGKHEEGAIPAVL